MNGLINLVGSGEYLPVMIEVDRYLLDSLNLNGRKPRVACLPTAAGKEGDSSINRWLNMGVQHFQELGAEVEPVRIIDRHSANDPCWEPILENADLIYFSGGDPSYLYETMKGSLAWSAAQRAWVRGAVYAGCSAGAMILGKRMPSFRLAGTQEGFGIVPATFIVPHFDAIPGIWKPIVFSLQRQLKKGERMIGVDEDTALIGKLDADWVVKGKSKVHVFARDGKVSYSDGQTLTLH
ncbi:MAG TPA: Type 1 glutamine amidotransferase-like domain-containing protein [Anaerolineales bacterium]|jgi:cyanophycinase|nr:Type 1 glutamine amidotransferase-like domain-containing protein [Anaerolineales bacterium]